MIATAKNDENIIEKSPNFISNSSGDLIDVLKEPKLVDIQVASETISNDTLRDNIETLMIDPNSRHTSTITKHKVAKLLANPLKVSKNHKQKTKEEDKPRLNFGEILENERH